MDIPLHKARLNESNALLGWMIYYFVFWLLPMQVDRHHIYYPSSRFHEDHPKLLFDTHQP